MEGGAITNEISGITEIRFDDANDWFELISTKKISNYPTVQLLKLSNVSVGSKISTGGTTWKILSSGASKGIAIANGNKAIPLNGMWAVDWDLFVDGVTDDTASAQEAVVDSYSIANTAIHYPAGIIVLTSELLVKQGVKLIGDQSQGSTEQYGTTFMVNHDGNGVHYEGSGQDFSGTGGGIKHFKVMKGNGFAGGQAILVDGTDINKRHGEMEIHDVLVVGTGTGEWQRGLDVDGSAYVTAGTKGIRTLNIIKLRVTDCSEDNEYVRLNQVTHSDSTKLQIDQGSGSGVPGMTINGDSDNVLFANANINGSLLIAATAVMNGFVFNGRCASFANSSANVDGIFCGQVSTTLSNSSNALNIISSNESFIKELTLNKPGGADDELLTMSNAGTKQLGLGTIGSAIVGLKPLVNNGETHLFATDGTGVERAVQVQFARLAASVDNLMNLGVISRRFAEAFIVTLKLGDGTTTFTTGSGTPEGSLSANIGSVYTRTDGGSSTTLYVKESGAGNTGWVAK